VFPNEVLPANWLSCHHICSQAIAQAAFRFLLYSLACMQAVAPDVFHMDGLRKALKKIERMGVQNNFADVMLDFKVGLHGGCCSTRATHHTPWHNY